MIFKTVSDDITGATKSISIFNSTLSTMKRNIKNGQGINYSIFSGNKLKQKDIQSVTNYANALKNGTNLGKAWNDNMKGCSVAAKQYVLNAKKAGKSTKEMVAGLKEVPKTSKAASLGMKALSTAGNMLAMWGISEVIGLAAKGIDYLINYEEKQAEAFENAKTATEEAAKSIRDIKSEMSDTSSKAKDLSSEYAKLVQGVNPFTNENEKLSTDDYEKFLDVNNQLAELFPSLTKNYDENGNAILGLSGDVDTVTASIQRLVEQQNNLAKADMRKHLEDYVNGTDDNEGVFKALEGSKKGVDDAKKEQKLLKKYYDAISKGKTIKISQEDDGLFAQIAEDKLGMSIEQLQQSEIKQNDVSVFFKDLFEIESPYHLYDFSKLKLDETTKSKITESYNNFYDDLQMDLSTKKSELESKNKEMSDQMMVWVEDLDIYKNSDNESFKRAIESMVGSIQWSDLEIEEGNIEEAKQLVQSLVLTPLSSACNDPNTKLQVTNAINSLFSIDFSKLSYKDAYEKIKGFLTILMNAINSGLPEDKKKSLDDMFAMFHLTEYQDSAGKMKKSLSSVAKEGSSDYQKLENYTAKFTQKQSEAWLTATNGAENAQDAINKYEESLKNASNNKKTVSFDKAWKSMDNDTKQKLLDAADVGELTGKKVKELAADDKELESAFESTGMSAAKFAESIREIEIDNIQEDINDCEKALQKMKNGQSLSSEETAELISKNSSLAGSIKKTKDGYKMEEDALISVMNTSKQKYNVVVANEILETNKVIDATNKRIDAYKAELKAIQTAMTARQEQYDSITNGGTQEDTYGLSPDETARALLGNTQASHDYSKSITLPKSIEKDKKKLKKYQRKLKKLTESLKKISSSGSKKDKNGSSKESKQTFDWIERRLKNLQNVIDFTASKLQNLFSVKAKNKNLDKQIKTTTKLINAYGTAASKYQQKADKIAGGSTKTVKGKNGKKKKVKTKGLSKNIIQKIKTGKLTKKTKLSSLIAEYGQSTAEKIQSYIDYYDKAQDAKKNKQDQIAKKRELKQQKSQNYVDLYDSRTARAEAKEAIAIGADNKNKSVDTQIKNSKLSYVYQIKIANLNKDKAKAQQLEYERDKQIIDLQKQKIENIKTEYANKIALLESGEGGSLSGEKDLQNQVALLQAKGEIVTAGYYSAQNKIENEKLDLQKEELAELISKQSTFAKGSDEWYELQSDIQSTQDAINESQIAIAENTKAIQELHTTMLDEMAESANRMNTEADFLAALLSRDELTDSDTGTFTNAGLGTLGAYGINMETAQAQMREWQKERSELEAMKASGKYDATRFNSWDEWEKAYNDAIQKQQEWTQNEFDAEQKIIDLMKERYQAQLDYMKEIIDARKTDLDLQKDLYDYQKSIAEKTKNIATLEKRLTALKGDTSEEGRARIAQIQLSLDEANQDLQDTEYDRYISDQQNMLDNMYNEYEDLMNHLFKDTDKLLQEGIQVINNNGTLIKGILDKKAEDYGYDYSGNFRGIMNAFTASDSIVTAIGNSINGKEDSSISKKLDTINTTIEKKYTKGNNGDGGDSDGAGGGTSGGSNSSSNNSQQTHTSNGQTTVTPDALDKIQGTNEKHKALTQALNSMKGAGYEEYWKIPNTDEGEPKSYVNKRIAAHPNYDKVYLNGKRSPQILTEKGLKLLAEKLGVKYPSSGGAKTADLKQYMKDAHFKTGGIAKLVKPVGEDGLGWMRNGEGFVAPEHVESIRNLMNIVPDMTKFTSALTNIKPVNREFGNQTFGDINLQLDLPNIENAQDLVSELQTNNSRTQKAFVIAVKDLVAKGKITNNIQSIR